MLASGVNLMHYENGAKKEDPGVANLNPKKRIKIIYLNQKENQSKDMSVQCSGIVEDEDESDFPLKSSKYFTKQDLAKCNPQNSITIATSISKDPLPQISRLALPLIEERQRSVKDLESAREMEQTTALQISHRQRQKGKAFKRESSVYDSQDYSMLDMCKKKLGLESNQQDKSRSRNKHKQRQSTTQNPD